MELLHLVIPGLFYPQLRGVNSSHVDIQAPCLEWLLHRATRSSTDAECLESTLLHLFNVRGSSDLPVAPIDYYGDFGKAPDSWCMRADPVFMVPDGDGLVLQHRFTADEISSEEASKTAQQFNQLYSDLDFHLSVSPHANNHWYLEFNSEPGMQTHPLYHVIGRNVNPYLPFGDNEQKWHQILNEFQMFLHSSEVNSKRHAEQKLLINSVWFWGEGLMPEFKECPWDHVYADQSFVASLAKLNKIAYKHHSNADLKETLVDNTKVKKLLWVVDSEERHENFEEWQVLVDHLEKTIFSVLKEAVQDKQLDHLILDTGLGTEFHISPNLTWKMLQRKKHFTDYLNAT